MKESMSHGKEEFEDYLQDCRTKEVIGGKIEQCLVENPACNHFIHFGAATFCNHPLRNQITKDNPEKTVSQLPTQIKNDFERNQISA